MTATTTLIMLIKDSVIVYNHVFAKSSYNRRIKEQYKIFGLLLALEYVKEDKNVYMLKLTDYDLLEFGYYDAGHQWHILQKD